ncbi:Zinc finger BED domain-containing protein 5 [Holothuria leucospilota]|uniref:Zinc finger BED domain-containing protein 5 n=1 Tax=Holothuria leucospilota TaxID=206669 RepID=A0A9Q0YN65_HOLLE|nr:Zinc finger BED domain-containing protein 5 [Holothuria leucospilota]
MQVKNSSVFQTCDKIEGFKLKVGLWVNAIDQGNLQMFPTLSEVLISLKCQAPGGIMRKHLQKLSEQLKSYFDYDLRERHKWIRNPFIIGPNDPNKLNIDQVASLMELKCDGSLKTLFREHTLQELWLAIKGEYTVLADKAVAFLLPFCTTWMCESGFQNEGSKQAFNGES